LRDPVSSLSIARKGRRRQDCHRDAKAIHYRNRRGHGDVQALAYTAKPAAAASPARSSIAQVSDDMSVRVDDRHLRLSEGGQCNPRRGWDK